MEEQSQSAAIVPHTNGQSIVRQGFGETTIENRRETAQTAQAAQAQAAIQARYIMSLQRPRNIDNVRVKLLSECDRPGFARAAYYSIERYDSTGRLRGRLTGTPGRVEGLSVRFVEGAIRIMGNVWQDSATIYDDDRSRIVRVAVTDLETNAAYSRDVTVTKTVERRKARDGQVVLSQRQNSAGQIVFLILASDDEILQREGSLISRTFRTEGLRLVPQDIIEECEIRIIATVRNEDAKDPGAARKQLADGFFQLNVLPSQISEYLGHDLSACSPAELTVLRGLYAAIRDGETTWFEAMSERDGSSPAASDAQQAPATETPKRGRGSRLASHVKAQGGAQPAAQQTSQPAQGEPRPQPQQETIPTTPATPTPPVQPQSATPPPQVATAPAQTSPAVNPTPQYAETNTKSEQQLVTEWRQPSGAAVRYTDKHGEVHDATTKGAPRLFGGVAVIEVNMGNGETEMVALRDIRPWGAS